MSLGDFALETTIHTKFTTRSFSTGAPATLSGTPVVDIYEDNSVTQITAAETLTVDFDSVTGLNHLAIAATAANGFEAGKFYQAVITTGTVGGVSVVGEVVAEFSIQAGAAFGRLGAPAGASIAADIATVDSNVDAILVDTGTTLPATLGTPAGADLATDIAAVKSDTAAILVDTADMQPKLGTPAGASISADIATVDSNVDAILVDTGTTIPALLPAALVGGKIDANVGAISTSTTAADNLEAGALGLVATTVNDASATTTSFIITSSEATDDHFNGRIITFTSGNLAGQSTDITDYTGATKTVTVTALTEAPANGDSFVIS